ncbi:MAG: tRNA uridine-5-carboxymethylaminomethyl(34) synthesis enzyme MnmG [Candidatus Omnitrophica bacterium]|nr:tRNA uridine-5-carboxymethylaminomethyl(34) synthesis enzyme MnmG [Candidatus Omnitrophota bacterium]MDD5351775.1 tRNA uridine-5-carboxymethylaminomethyl(34) synthesis enzyme MnmG [Candidatus Omnitrophota bacterium]MDD5550601.1 tRNA uridine-5-carboxymethylaminomethyl(34) synthesis enzyme MnmG [Candidatus Omnitrophota bacterium]
MVYDVIVVGGGHAGTEAALAAAKLDCSTLLISMNLDTVGLMSCNPAIGGLGKGQLVKEIDALGGFMGIAADNCAIQFRRLNVSKGPAVRSSRSQEDRQRYRLFVKQTLENQENLCLYQAQVTEIIAKHGVVRGVKTSLGEKFLCKTLVITPGTFLNGLIHIGLQHFSGGRLGEDAAISLSSSLKDLGFRLARFKTGTCARLDKRTINFRKLKIQDGDKEPQPFSFSTKELNIKQIPCYITYTGAKTHKIIRCGLKYSPLYTGKIKATGVRYCPSIEDKVVKFSDRERHQIFLEPEGRDTIEIYPNGVSTSLPVGVQIKMLRSIEGLEKVRILRPGYGIEHDIVDPTQLDLTLETKQIRNLFLAGQINGTTGYEEAAAQGLIAGINAALKVKNKKQFILGRDQAYIGVLIDDLTTKGTNEPYRMFTSRVEYRLLLREDNADQRLRKFGFEIGLVKSKDYQYTQKKIRQINAGVKILNTNKIKPTAKINKRLKSLGTVALKNHVFLVDLLRRPQINIYELVKLNKLKLNFPKEVLEEIEIDVKYEGFIKRQLEEIARFNRVDKIKIPQSIDYKNIPSLSREIQEKLEKYQPLTLGQASRISGVTPAAISLLMIYLRKFKGSTA